MERERLQERERVREREREPKTDRKRVRVIKRKRARQTEKHRENIEEANSEKNWKIMEAELEDSREAWREKRGKRRGICQLRSLEVLLCARGESRGKAEERR